MKIIQESSIRMVIWRGPNREGVSKQTGLPQDLMIHYYGHDIRGGVPVVAGGKAYQFDNPKPRMIWEALVCFMQVGNVLWEKRHGDFISDIVYNRYGVGAACVDPHR